jgi:hypothetical protein
MIERHSQSPKKEGGSIEISREGNEVSVFELL